MSGSTPLLSSRALSARSFPAPRLNDSVTPQLKNGKMQLQDSDRLDTQNLPKPSRKDENRTSIYIHNTGRFKCHAIGSNIRASTSSLEKKPPRRTWRPLKKMHHNDHDHNFKAFHKLADKAASLTEVELDKLLLDAGLGDGILSARRINEGSSKRDQVLAANLTIRLSSDFAALKKIGCSDSTLLALRAIDPPQQDIEIVAEKVATGDMTMLSAPPELKLEPTPARHFAIHHRQHSSAEVVHNPKMPMASADYDSSMVRRQPVRRAGCGGSPLPPLLDWTLEAGASPVNFCSMNSHVPRFSEAPPQHLASTNDRAITDWANCFQGTSYSCRSVFKGPPRFREAKRDIVTPPPSQASNQSSNHDRRSCTAQHKQQREPNLMLESRISAALAKEAKAPTTSERMGLKSVQDRAAALEVDQIGNYYGAKDHERIRNKQDRLLEVMVCLHVSFFLS